MNQPLIRIGLALAMAWLAPAAHAAATGPVCLYKDANYGGKPNCKSADTPNLKDTWNDKTSSVKVSAGYEATLFENKQYGGRSLTLKVHTASLAGANFNDITTSLKVVKKCTAVSWQEGVNYWLGDVVRFEPNGQYYKVINVTANGTDGTNPTISTWYWAPTTCGDGGGDSGKLSGGYYVNWTPSPLRLRDLPLNYNLVYLFHAVPVGGPPGTTGAVTYSPPGDGRGAATHLNEDIAYARTVQHRKVLLSVGGAKNGMSFPTRTKSQTFVDSIVSIYNQLGGFDGMDWNTFEGDQTPDTSEMAWISKELKRLYPGFIISAPPAPWNPVDKTFCKDMLNAGAIDYCAPQYYDGPGLAEPDYVVGNVQEWVNLLGPTHVMVGLGINTSLPNYMTKAQAIDTWTRVEAANPTIHGGFDWETGTDETQGWPFANGVAPLILH